MNLIESVRTCFNNYANFKGRASRSEYWWWWLMPLSVWTIGSINYILFFIVALALILPTLAVGSRRLHDMGHSGWWQVFLVISLLFWFIPLSTIMPLYMWVHIMYELFGSLTVDLIALIGIIPLIMCLFPSRPKGDKYGPPLSS